MRVQPSQYALAFEELSQEGALETGELALNIVALLKRRDALRILPLIVKELEKREERAKNELRVTVVTRMKPTKEERQNLESLAAEVFPNQVLVFDFETDERVLGGVCFSTEEALYDATILARFRALRKAVVL